MYVNDKAVQGKALLKTGDVIFIKGLKMIWMNNFMIICSLPGNVTINHSFLPTFAEGNYDNASAYKPTQCFARIIKRAVDNISCNKN